MDSALSIKNASGKTFSLLNENTNSTVITPFKVNKLTSSLTTPIPPKRKYPCMEPGCNKSFTTSGHLARHNRIHTGEKNFHCLHPGCPSRFSRQDNMMQHYRTHLSQKARRSNNRSTTLHPKRSVRETDSRPTLLDHHHSYHFHERMLFLQPLTTTTTATTATTATTRTKRSTTMPSLPRPDIIEPRHINRPKRALSSSSHHESHHVHIPHPVILPPPNLRHYHHHHQPQPQQQQHHEWKPDNQKPLTSNLLHLANIVSSFG